MVNVDNNEFAYIVDRIKQYATDARAELKKTPNDVFIRGKLMAYYEIIGTIKNQAEIYGNNIKELGLDFDAEEYIK